MCFIQYDDAVSIEERIVYSPVRREKVVIIAYNIFVICTYTYSRKSIPSVMYFKIVLLDVLSSNRIE